VIRVRWTAERVGGGAPRVFADGPVLLGGDQHTDVPVGLYLPNPFGGTTRADVFVQPGATMTLAFSWEPDPPVGDDE
jgi:hypothetical protein